jgi:hypothetical protein
VAWGGPPRDEDIDGTVVPSAAGGSLMFAPDISVPALIAMKEKFGETIWGHYGFVDAFNPNIGWIDQDGIAINLGITLVSAENLRSRHVWRWFMRNVEIPHAMRLVGLIGNRPRRLQRRNSRPARMVSMISPHTTPTVTYASKGPAESLTAIA